MTGLAALGMLMLVVMLFAIFIGFPISFTLLFLALTFGYFALGETVFSLAYFQTIGMMKESLLAAVPLFIFMGFITEQAGLMERLFSAFRMLLAPVRGALFLVVIVTSAVFAMATGIVGAAVTVLGIMASPIMIKTGYDGRLAAGAITAGGTLGILIPPSVMLIVMGPVLGISVADLYAAALGPGFLLAGIYFAYLLGRCMLNPKLGPPVPKEERVGSADAFAMLDELAAAARRHPDADCFGGRIRIEEAGVPRWVLRSRLRQLLTSAHDYGDSEGPYPPNRLPIGPNMAVRRRAVRLQEPWPVDLGPGSPIPIGDETAFLYGLGLRSAQVIYVPTAEVRHQPEPSYFAMRFALRRAYLAGYSAGFVNARYRAQAAPELIGTPVWQKIAGTASWREFCCSAIRLIGYLVGFGRERAKSGGH